MTAGQKTSDLIIRTALHKQYLRKEKSRSDTLVIDELGLAHSRSRIDVAVINGSIHGYEIKSEKDSLDRLANQIKIYRKALQKLTIVTAPRHIDEVSAYVPVWCGLIEVKIGPRGGIQFQPVRCAADNPEIDPVVLAHLLWRNEVIDLLSKIGCSPRDLRMPRKYLYEMLCNLYSPQQITASIRYFMGRRQAWRDRPELVSYGD